MPLRTDPFIDLRTAIDNGNVESIQKFITLNPDLNYNNIAPNGASALWWALTPQDGQRSLPVVEFLLGYLKDNGEPLINLMQPFDGWTAPQFVKEEMPCDSFIVDRIKRAENAYVAPVQNGPQNLAAIARDAQNVHDSTTVKLSRMNLTRLHQRYVKDDNALNFANQSKCERELQLLLNSQLPDPQPAWKQPHFLNSVIAGLNYCFRTAVTFQICENPDITLNLAQLVTLVWYGVNDNSDAVLPGDLEPKDQAKESKENKIDRICSILHEVATAYGEGHPSCAGGSCIRMGQALAGSHVDALSSIPGEPLTGEEAQRAFVKFLGKKLAHLALTPETYWPILRSQCNASSKQDDDALENYLLENQQTFAKQLVLTEEIEEKTAKKNLAVLSGGDFPLKGHLLSRNLKEVFDVLFQDADECKQFCAEKKPEALFEEAFGKLTDQFITTLFWQNAANQYGFKPDDKALAHNFLRNWQYLSAHHSKIPLPLATLFSQKELSVETNECIKTCMPLSLFQKQQEILKTKFPKLKEWLEHLTLVQMNDLIDQLNKADPKALENLSEKDNVALLVECALRSGFCSYLQLDGMIFKKRDFRGVNFNRVNFDNAQFEDCDLRLTLWTETSCKNLKIKNCLVPLIEVKENSGPNIIANKLRRICSREIKIPQATVSAIFANDAFNKASFVLAADYETRLMIATKNGQYEVVTAMLASPYCTKKYVNWVDYYKETVLIYAARSPQPKCINAILDSPYGSKELFEKTNAKGQTAVLVSVLSGSSKNLKALLASTYCSTEFVEKTYSNSGETILTAAAEAGSLNSVNVILASKHCRKELLEMSNHHGNTALMLAVSMGRTEVVKALIASPHCRKELLEKINKEGDTALMIAARHGHTEMVKAFLESPHCTKELFEKSNNAGNTAPFIAISAGRTESVNELLKSPFCTKEQFEKTNQNGQSILLVAASAARAGDAEMKALLASPFCTKQLLEKTNKEGESALFVAACCGKNRVVKVLLDTEHFKNELLEKGDAVLRMAIKHGGTDVVKVLLDSPHFSKELFEKADAQGQTALMLACRDNEITALLLNSRFFTKEFLDKVDSEGDNALMYASRTRANVTTTILNSPHCSKELLEHSNKAGKNALMIAVEKPSLDTVKALLLSFHCTKELLEKKNKDGNTLLMLAAFGDDFDLMLTLVKSQCCSLKVIRDLHATPYMKIATYMKDKPDAIISLQKIDEYLNPSFGFFRGEKRHHKAFLREAIKDESQSIGQVKRKIIEYVATDVEINPKGHFAEICKLLEINITKPPQAQPLLPDLNR